MYMYVHVYMCTQIFVSASLNSGGVDFLGYQPGLRRGCFLAMDAVKWMREKVGGVTTRKEAVKILQVLLTYIHMHNNIIFMYIN